MKIYKGIISLLGAFPLLLASCSDNDLAGNNGNLSSEDFEMSEVTFNITTEQLASTRAEASDGMSYISTGQMVDELIYAIYESEAGKDNYKLAGYYQANFGDAEKAGQGDNYNSIPEGNRPSAIPAGQTYVGYKAGDKYSVTMKVNKDRDYKIVCWAQSSECNAYDTSDLSKVKVSYDDALNNDESRDAFTGYTEFSGNLRYQNVEVVMRRPLSQINIGTSGADYANLIYDPNLNPNGVTITESTITVSGVANRYDALTSKAVYESDNSNQKAVFAWSALPAWINSGMPEFKSSGLYEKESNPFIEIKYGSGDAKPEEFLYVKLNEDNDDPLQYVTEYPTVKINDDDTEEYLTETFKYLSMCYILIPSENTGNDNTGSKVTVNFNLRQGKGINNEKVIPLIERELINVPVKPNYRTNIIGGLYTEENAPDPSSIFSFYQLPIVLNEEFTEHHNSRYYTAVFNFHRDQTNNDELKYSVSNEEGTKEVEGDEAYMSIFFTGDNVVYTFTCNDGFDIEVDSNVNQKEKDGTINWSFKDGKLTLYPGASAGAFNIWVTTKGSNEPGSDGTEPSI